jgi:GAF domain-containing protein
MGRTKRDIERNEQTYQLSTLAAGAFSLQEVLDRLAESAVKIVNAKACSIRLLDEETHDLKMRSTYGLSEEYRNKGVVTKDDEVIRAAFAGEAVVIDDMRDDGRIQYRQATSAEGLVSQLTVAMQFRNKPIGVLRLYSPRPRGFVDADTPVARARRCGSLHPLFRRGRGFLRFSAHRRRAARRDDCRCHRQGRSGRDYDELVSRGRTSLHRRLSRGPQGRGTDRRRSEQWAQGGHSHQECGREFQQDGLPRVLRR